MCKHYLRPIADVHSNGRKPRMVYGPRRVQIWAGTLTSTGAASGNDASLPASLEDSANYSGTNAPRAPDNHANSVSVGVPGHGIAGFTRHGCMPARSSSVAQSAP